MEEFKSLKIFCITYNTKEKTLSPEQISELLTPHKNLEYDIYILSFQELERKTYINIFYSDKSEIESKLISFFSPSYFNLPSITLGGMYSLIFIKNEHKDFISDYSNNYIKTGFYGFIGNKGAISIKFKIYNFSFFIINCHLIPGENKIEYRNKDVNYIYNNISENINSNDIIIWSGCFNYRVDALLAQFSNAYIKGKELDLLEKDQIIKMMNDKENNDVILKEFNEGKISFLMSSKYQIGGDTINWTDKHNYPGWTDRIFFKPLDILINFYILNNRIESSNSEKFSFGVNKYDCMKEITFSDHKPVYAYFEFKYKI